MTFNSDKCKRRSIRLDGYDYAQSGAYFVTVCTHDRKRLFGDIVEGKMVLNDAGRAVNRCWQDIPAHFPHVALDEWVIMPNHVHGVLFIKDGHTGMGVNVGVNVGAKDFSPLHPRYSRPKGTSKTIGSMIRGFKIGVTKWFHLHNSDAVVWQRNYYEHVVRNESDLNRIREYIIHNPEQWETDQENPAVRKQQES